MKDLLQSNLEALLKQMPNFGMYLKNDPLHEEEDSQFSFDPVSNVLCVFGLEGGNPYVHLKEWLQKDPDRVLVFIEDNPAKILSFAQKKIAQEILCHHQVSLYFLEMPLQIETIFKKIAWRYVFLSIELVAVASYASRELFFKMKLLFERISYGVHLVASDSSDLYERCAKNIYENLCNTAQVRKGLALKNAFSNIPALICGGGPSLQTNIQQLHQLEERALIFAGGAALNILAEHNICPHFAGGIDKAANYSAFSAQRIWEIPFFYQNRISSENLQTVHGEKLLVEDVGERPLEKWLFEQLDLQEEHFEAGWTVGTFLTHIACLLGCNPIIFVGMDFSYEKKDAYSKGVGLSKEKKANCLKITKEQNGNSFVTQKDWVLAKQWIEEFAEKNSQKTFLNATEGGLGFNGIVDQPLHIVSNTYLKKSWDLHGWIHATMQSISSHSLQAKKVLHLLKQSLEEVQAACDRQMFSPEALDFSDYLCYSLLLEPIWNVWRYPLEREVEKEKSPIEKNKRLLLHKLLFLRQTAHLHQTLIERIS